ncbi:hypothetical protein DLAC_00990 [Tieghemostelium lacteum]|uniref:Uncharacterized protein n=1 Tax=Tieghemostelium lacteum TaxID=361077 RepID=A0A152A7K0_TIELA|nr:hypothetical protein DLAC_00990 [Tieghemostelium lacteum]|eukprot:KYR02176.1 hypothetical protein DLAC_00990 [Tieghemostelium lacteum]
MNSLFDKIVKASERATKIGAIEKIESNPIFIKDSNVNFLVSVAKSLLKRPFNYPKSDSGELIPPVVNDKKNSEVVVDSEEQKSEKKDKVFIDPFLPCDKDLFVCQLSKGTHNLVLNKFNVSNYHSIIATSDFQHQTDNLNTLDFKAIWECIGSGNMLSFFNCGPNSGASQPHKHIQLLVIPFHNDCSPYNIPMESLLVKYKYQPNQLHEVDKVFQIEELPFRNAALYYNLDHLKSMNNDSESISKYLELKYLSLMNNLDLNNSNSNDSQQQLKNSSNNISNFKSYNFIMTSEWMFLVPRSVYQSRGISINSVGFTGAILVRKEEDLDTIQKHGIMNILTEVSIPK